MAAKAERRKTACRADFKTAQAMVKMGFMGALRASSLRGVETMHGLERHGAEQAGDGDWPRGGVEAFASDAHKVDVVKNAPLHVVLVEVADAVGGDVGDFDFEFVALQLQRWKRHLIRRGEAGAESVSVETDARALRHGAEVEQPMVSRWLRRIEGEAIAGGCSSAPFAP